MLFELRGYGMVTIPHPPEGIAPERWQAGAAYGLRQFAQLPPAVRQGVYDDLVTKISTLKDWQNLHDVISGEVQ